MDDTANTVDKLSDIEQVKWLLAHGWRLRTGSSAWRFSKPPYRGVYYTLKDAVELERSRSKASIP